MRGFSWSGEGADLGMGTGAFDVNAASHVRLDAIEADRNRPENHVWRARIVLLTDDGAGRA
jgi:hypothetical protein